MLFKRIPYFHRRVRWVPSVAQSVASQGSYTLSGQAVALLSGNTLGHGSFTFTGQPANLSSPAGEGGIGLYTLSGRASAFDIQILADGTYAGFGFAQYDVFGSSVNFAVTLTQPIVLAGNFGTYQVTGSAASFRRAQTSTFGNYQYTGQAATLLFQENPPIVLPAVFGAYVFAGVQAQFPATNAAGTGLYVFSGRTATLTSGVVTAHGTYSVTGQAAAFAGSAVNDTGQYQLTGVAAELVLSNIQPFDLPVDAGAYALTGVQAQFPAANTAGTGLYVLDGRAASFAREAAGNQGAYTLTGFPVLLLQNQFFAPGAYNLLGQSIQFLEAAASPFGLYTVTGIAVQFPATNILSTGFYVLRGQSLQPLRNFGAGKSKGKGRGARRRWQVEYKGQILEFSTAQEAHEWLASHYEAPVVTPLPSRLPKSPFFAPWELNPSAGPPQIAFDGVDVTEFRPLEASVLDEIMKGTNLAVMERLIQAEIEDEEAAMALLY